MRAEREMRAPPEPAGVRPTSPRWRLLRAYWVTGLVVASYVSLKVFARLRGPDANERVLRRKHVRNARRIFRAIASLQGLYIKVGQLISILTNFLPEEFRGELEALQDRVPPRPYREIEARLGRELGPPREVFAQFDERPIASASIGQVHLATLRDGRRVAVKVQYPDIEEIVRVDLVVLQRIFGVLAYFLPHHGLPGVYREIRAMILQELDFVREADSIEAIAENFAGHPDVSLPRVIRELCTARVLTTEFVEGVKVNDLARLDAGRIDRRALARLVVGAYCKQIFTDGLYHADPHPGNILVQPGPHIVFLDFGAVGRVSPAMRQGLADLIQGALGRDTARVTMALKKMGFVAREADPRVFDRIVEYFHERFQEEIHLESFNLKDVRFDAEKGFEHLADLRRMDISLRDVTSSFHVPKDWILLERTVLLLMGLCTELDPRMNPMEVIRPYLEEFVFGKDRDVSRFVMETTKEIGMAALAIPSDLRRFLGRAMRGELEVRFVGIDESVRALYSLGHQAIWAAAAIASASFALVFEGRGRFGAARIAWGTAAAFALAVLWTMRQARNRMRHRRRR
jgi:ubiquinone biosynthesis protein